MLPDWLSNIDPEEGNWRNDGLNRWTLISTGKQYNSGDMVNYMIQKLNAERKANGEAPFVAGRDPIPDELKTIPEGMPYEEYIKHAPPDDWDIVKKRQEAQNPTNPGSGGGTGGTGGDGYLNDLDPDFEWTGNGGPGLANPMKVSNLVAGPQWSPTGGGSNENPTRTGQREAFSPFGDVNQYSSEILRYGGPLDKNSGGQWTNVNIPTMTPIGGAKPNSNPGVNVPEFKPIDPYVQQTPVRGGGYQNETISSRDGETYTDPNTGQTYVFRNGQFQKRDSRDRLGPTTTDNTVTNRGGTGTDADPFDLALDGLTEQQIAAEILRGGAGAY